MNLKYMAAISHVSNITGLTVSMPKITNGIKILINLASAAADMIPDSFISLLSVLIVVSEQRYILTWEYVITCETNR